MLRNAAEQVDDSFSSSGDVENNLEYPLRKTCGEKIKLIGNLLVIFKVKIMTIQDIFPTSTKCHIKHGFS